MSERYQPPDGDSMKVAEQVFDVLIAEASLGGSRDADGAARLSLHRLYGYVTGARAEDPELEAALAQDPALRADLRRLTGKIAGYRVPELAAAASGSVAQRTAPGCQIRFEPSRAEPAQTYIVISLDDPGRQPRWLAVFFGDDRCRRIALPEPRDGLIQLLIESESEIMTALRNPGSEIFIDG